MIKIEITTEKQRYDMGLMVAAGMQALIVSQPEDITPFMISVLIELSTSPRIEEAEEFYGKAPAHEALLDSKKLTKKEAQRADVNAYQRKYAQDRRKFKSLKAAGKLPKKMTIGQYRASL